MTRSTTGRDDYVHVIDLFAQITALPDDDPERKQLRTQIIEACLPVAEHIARRYRGRGQPHEDLVQVASVGLINAVDRFDLEKGKDFLSFAVPTMTGEVRRHFRDHGWDIRVPRSLQESYLALKKARTSLTQTLGHEPTVPELADYLHVERRDIDQTVAAGDSYYSTPLDAATSTDGIPLGDTLGDDDAALETIDNHETLRPALLALPERERAIVHYRFFDELTQSEIAAKFGLSQMHVSRLLAQSLTTWRTKLDGRPA
jgi:RNA polymerase sigma-B factor